MLLNVPDVARNDTFPLTAFASPSTASQANENTPAAALILASDC